MALIKIFGIVPHSPFWKCNRSVPTSGINYARKGLMIVKQNTLQFLAISVCSSYMKEPAASPVASCPECGQLRAALDLSFTHIFLLTEVLTAINLPAIF